MQAGCSRLAPLRAPMKQDTEDRLRKRSEQGARKPCVQVGPGRLAQLREHQVHRGQHSRHTRGLHVEAVQPLQASQVQVDRLPEVRGRLACKTGQLDSNCMASSCTWRVITVPAGTAQLHAHTLVAAAANASSRTPSNAASTPLMNSLETLSVCLPRAHRARTAART